MYRIRDLPAVDSTGFGCLTILVSDLLGAFRLTDDAMIRMTTQLSSYGLGHLILREQCDVEIPSLRLAATNSGCCVWEHLAEFAVGAGEPIEAFSVDMDFGRLDEY